MSGSISEVGANVLLLLARLGINEDNCNVAVASPVMKGLFRRLARKTTKKDYF